MKKILWLFFILFCLNSYALDLSDVRSRLSRDQELKFIDNIPFITDRTESQYGKSVYSIEKKLYYVSFELKPAFKNISEIINKIQEYKPDMFKSINVFSVNTTEDRLTDIVNRLKKYINIEFISKETTKAPLGVLEDISKEPFQGGIGSGQIPNDPLFSKQWHLDCSNNNCNYDLKYLDFQDYLNKNKLKRNFKNSEPVVALIDMGFYLDTDEFKNRIWVNNQEIPNNGIDDDNNGYVDDYRGVHVNPHKQNCTPNLSSCIGDFDKAGTFKHGMVVGSIIAAATNNNKFIAGMAPADIKILPISTENDNATRSLYFSNGYDYILTLRKRGVNIIAYNISLGGAYDATEEKFITEMKKYGILSIASAGNNSTNIDTDGKYNYPAALASKLDNIVSVGAINSYKAISSYSNYGNKNLSIYLPGDSISGIYYENGKVDGRAMSGTSAAAAVMSGVLANAYWLFPNDNMIELKNKILRNVTIFKEYANIEDEYPIKTTDFMTLTNMK